MTPRALLSEDADREEREGADKLRTLEDRLRVLWGRRDTLLQQARKVAEEQRALFDSRGPKQERLEATHREHREAGHRLAELRRERDQARASLEEAIVAARLARQDIPRGGSTRPELIRREMAQLELRQQTRALPLSEENALIDHLRDLRRQLNSAEQNRTFVQARQQTVQSRETALRESREKLALLSESFDRTKAERDHLMGSMRAQLLEVGDLVAQIRAKSAARAESTAALDTVMTEIRSLESEARALVAASRARRAEARKTILDYSREVSRGPSTDQRADARLDELLKRGRITLG